MTKYCIKTHRLGATYNQPHFFVLNKGLNSGKPLEQPCSNCFVLELLTNEEKENHFWLAYSLWHSKFWRIHLVGSVIEFLKIHDFQLYFTQKSRMIQEDPEKHQRNIKALKLIEEKETEFLTNLKVLNQLRSAIAHQFAKI